MAGASFRSSQVLFLARSAHDRARTTPGEVEVCIALCAATLEGFLNELAYTFRTWTGPPSAVALSGLLDEAEEAHASPVAKLRFAAYALGGSFPSKGGYEIQRVTALFRLRNSLMHLRPEPVFTMLDEHPYLEQNLKPPAEIAFLMNEGLIILPPAYTGTWRDLITKQPVARWAYNTVVQTILWVKSMARDPSILGVLNVQTFGLAELSKDSAA